MRQIGCAVLLIGLLGLVPARTAGASGPHFMGEAGAGVMRGLSATEGLSFGHAVDALVGVGGRPAGSWLRYYFIVELLNGAYDATVAQNLRMVSVNRALLEVGVGGRLVAPLTPHVRLFLDAEGVAVRSQTTFGGTHLVSTRSSDLDWGLRLATGLQVRPIELLSAGVRVSVTTAFDELDGEATAGWLRDFDAEAGHFDATFQLTFYF